MSGDDEWVSTEEAARRLGVHPDTAREWFDQGILTGYRTRPGGGWRRVYVSSIERLLEQRRGGTGEPEPPAAP